MKAVFHNVECDGKHTECIKVQSGHLVYDVLPFIVSIPAILVSVLMFPACFVSFLPLNICMMLTYRKVCPNTLYRILLWTTLAFCGCVLALQCATALVFSLPFFVLWPRQFLKNVEMVKLAYYKPSLHYNHFVEDMWNCHSGMYLRQKNECLLSLPCMVCFVPVVKWYITNPFLRKLTFVDVNQVSYTMKCKNDKELYALVKEVLSHKNVSTEVAKKIDEIIFMGFYPSNDFGHTVGIQMGMSGYINMLVWTEYVKHAAVVARVFISCVNPYHFVTGYVEVNVNQKKIGHPMRILTDRRSRACMEKIRDIDKTFACTFSNCDTILNILKHEKLSARAAA